MSEIYGTRQGVQGKARRSLSLPAREVASADATADRLSLEAHGLSADDPVQFRVEVGGTLPAPLSASAVYYAKPVADSNSLFQVAATAGGAAINLTTAGTAPFSLIVDVGSMLDTALEHFSRWVDALYTAHGVPFTPPYPKVIVNVVEYLALASVARQLRMAKDFADIIVEAEEFKKDILRMAKSGQTLRDATATPAAQLAVHGSAASAAGRRMGTLP